MSTGAAGTVELELTLDAQGNVVEARVLRSPGHGLAESLLQVVGTFRFSRYSEMGGKPGMVVLALGMGVFAVVLFATAGDLNYGPERSETR